MSEKLNANLVSLYLSKRLWKHPIKNEVYYFTNTSVLTENGDFTENLVAMVTTSTGNKNIIYQLYDKIIDNTLEPFISIESEEYQILYLEVGHPDDKFVLKSKVNDEFIFVPHILNV